PENPRVEHTNPRRERTPMHPLLHHWSTLLQHTPFGGGVTTLNETQALLWVQTSADPIHRVTRRISLESLERTGARQLAGLIAEAYEVMATPPELSMLVHERRVLVTPSSPESHEPFEIFDLPASAIEPLEDEEEEEDDEVSSTQRLDVVHISTIAALMRADESQRQTLRPGHGEDARPTAVYAPGPSSTDKHTLVLSRELHGLIEQCKRTIHTLDPPGDLEFVDDETLLLRVSLGEGQKPYVRMVDTHDFLKRAIVILSETWYEARQRFSPASIARAQ
ncbi:MAG: hypothetical protein AAGI01_12370, partial [Myxococcota bacterium]